MKRCAALTFLFSACFAFGARVLADKPKPDPRLEQKVTVEAVGAALRDVLADLSQKTGVSLDLHLNLKNQKVTVLVDDQPLYVVMNQLRDLLDALWFTEDVKGKTGYYLQQKAGWQFEAARLRAQRQAKKQRKETEFRTRVREAARVAGLPRDQLVAMLDTDPQSVIDALWCGWPADEQEGLVGAAPLVAELSEAQLNLVFGGTSVTVAYADLSPAGRATVDNVCHAMEQTASPSPRLLSVADPALLFAYVVRQRTGDQEYLEMRLTGSAGSQGTEVARVGLSREAWWTHFGWPAKIAGALGITEAELRHRLEATPRGQATLSPPPSQAKSPDEVALHAAYQPLRPEESLDLELGKDLNLEPRHPPVGWPLESVLQAMHRKAGVQVLADSYVVVAGHGFYQERVPKDRDQLIARVAVLFRRAWKRDGDIYRLRSRTWYVDEFLEPPLWLIQRLQGKLNRDTGDFELDLGDYLAAFTTLTDEQCEALAAARTQPSYYEAVLRVGLHTGRPAAALRFYASLDAMQQQNARGEGIGMASLNPAQREAFAGVLSHVFREEVPEPQAASATVRLVFTREEYEGRQSPQLVASRTPWRQPSEARIEKAAVFAFTLGGGRREEVRLLLAQVPAQAKEAAR